MPLPDPGHDRFFRRFHPEDPGEVGRQIEADRGRLTAIRASGDRQTEMSICLGMGFGLYITGAEAEAAPVLDRALALARALGDRAVEIEALLHLATARQYLGERVLAQSLFREALERSSAYGIDTFEHFILHHQGRCFAEQAMIADARACFTRALALRVTLGMERFIRSSKAALDELATLE
jgi:tetratricopeptide (TPR) repeat protein